MKLFPKAEFVLEVSAPVEVIQARLAANVVESFSYGQSAMFIGQVESAGFDVVTTDRIRMTGALAPAEGKCEIRVRVRLEEWSSWLDGLQMIGFAALLCVLVWIVPDPKSAILTITIAIACAFQLLRPIRALISARSRFNSARAQLVYVLRGDPLFV